MTRIKTVRERTSVPSQLAGIVAVVVPPLGLVSPPGGRHRHRRNLRPAVHPGCRSLLREQTTTRGYETGTSGWARAGTRGHSRNSVKGEFAGKRDRQCPAVPALTALEPPW